MPNGTMLLLVIPFLVGIPSSGSAALASGTGVGTLPLGTQIDAAISASYGSPA